MNWGLFWVGTLSALIGLVLLFLRVGGKVSADTDFGKVSGGIGGVVLVLGLLMQAASVLA